MYSHNYSTGVHVLKMADCQVADGKAVAAEVRSKLAAELNELKENYPGFQPQLSIVQVSLPPAGLFPLKVNSMSLKFNTKGMAKPVCRKCNHFISECPILDGFTHTIALLLYC